MHRKSDSVCGTLKKTLETTNVYQKPSQQTNNTQDNTKTLHISKKLKLPNSKHPKIQKSKNLKIKNPKIQKSKNPKIQKKLQDSVDVKKFWIFGFFFIFGFLGFWNFCVLHRCFQSVETAPKLDSEKTGVCIGIYSVLWGVRVVGGVTIYIYIYVYQKHMHVQI